jgi:hypothetical protein
MKTKNKNISTNHYNNHYRYLFSNFEVISSRACLKLPLLDLKLPAVVFLGKSTGTLAVVAILA